MLSNAPSRDHATRIVQLQSLAERSSSHWNQFGLRSLPEASTHPTYPDNRLSLRVDAADPVASILHDDEELPDYDSINSGIHPPLPEYEEDRLRTPVVLYHLRSISPKAQYLIRQDCDRRDSVSSLSTVPRATSYAVLNRSKPSFLSKQADVSIYACEKPGLQDLPEAVVRKQTDVSLPKIASINADRSNTIPWMPRASIDHWSCEEARVPNSGWRTPTNYPMSAPNFSDWKIKIVDRVLIWALSARPASLLLVDKSSQEVLARFIYSERGTTAAKDQDIGSFEFYKVWNRETELTTDSSVLPRSDPGQVDRTLQELILASGLVVIRQWKSMGRHYRNDRSTEYRAPELSRHSNAFIPPLTRGQSIVQIGTRTNAEIARRNSTVV